MDLELNPVLKETLTIDRHLPMRLDEISPKHLAILWSRTRPARNLVSLRFPLEVIFVDTENEISEMNSFDFSQSRHRTLVRDKQAARLRVKLVTERPYANFPQRTFRSSRRKEVVNDWQLFLGTFPGFTTFVSLSSVDDDRVFRHLNHLVEDLVEFRLVRIADFAVVGDFHDCLTSGLCERGLIQVGKHKPNGVDVVGSASSIDNQRLFLRCLCRFHRIFHPIKPLLVIAIVTCRANLN